MNVPQKQIADVKADIKKAEEVIKSTQQELELKEELLEILLECKNDAV